MLESIYNAIKAIGDFFATIGTFIVSFFEDLVEIVKITGQAIANIPSYISWLPLEVVAIILIIFSVVVLYKVLGREG